MQQTSKGKWQIIPRPLPPNVPLPYMTEGGKVPIISGRGPTNYREVSPGGGATPTGGEQPEGQSGGTTRFLPRPSVLTAPAMEDLTQGIQAMRDLTIMEQNIGATGGLTGLANKAALNLSILKPFDLASDPARAFQTARDRLRLASQAMIKGIPSNYDVQIVLDTLADLGINEKTNKERLSQARNAYTSVLRDTIAFHKGSNQIIPDHISRMAQAVGVDVKSIKPWDGKSDPFENTMQNHKFKPDLEKLRKKYKY
jgi:hypothetical protein